MIPVPEIYDRAQTHRAIDAAGQRHDLREEIPISYAEALYGYVRRHRPVTILEVGLATGTSALAMAQALRENGRGGRIISIDPRQSTDWSDIGRASIRRGGFEDLHECIEDYDFRVLPRLLDEGLKIDFAYIDGWHTFDYVLLDFFYIDKMLRPGGAVGFNDSGWPATFRVIKFLRTHRRYSELDVGLRPTYNGRLPVLSPLYKRVAGRSDPDRYFRKLDEWEPTATKFYRRF